MRKKRSLWKVPGRTEQWWLNLDSGVSPPEVWKKNFRVRSEDFLELVEMIRPYARERSKRAQQDIYTGKKGGSDVELSQGSGINSNDCKCCERTLPYPIKERCSLHD